MIAGVTLHARDSLGRVQTEAGVVSTSRSNIQGSEPYTPPTSYAKVAREVVLDAIRSAQMDVSPLALQLVGERFGITKRQAAKTFYN